MDYYNIANLHHQVNGGLWSKTTLICCKIADLLNHKPQTKTRTYYLHIRRQTHRLNTHTTNNNAHVLNNNAHVLNNNAHVLNKNAHVFQDMTSIVRRLSRDMERCEGAVSSNTAAINTLSARLASLEGGSAVNADMDTRINRWDTANCREY